MNKKRTSSIMTYLMFVMMMTIPAFSSMGQDLTAQSLLQGIFTTEQVERGGVAFREICETCHLVQHFRGIIEQSDSSNDLIADYYDIIRLTMPEDSPGSLPEQQYLDIMAYILFINNFPGYW